MSAMTAEDDDDFDDLLPDDLLPSKGKAKPLKRSKKQTQTLVAKAEADRVALAEKASAAQLAQIVNLHIAGISLAEIGSQIGMTAAEVDQMLQRDAQRYVRSQPALRVYVRNFISKEYSEMLDANRAIATDASHAEKLEHQDRQIRILKDMARLHGAEAPVQSEVKVEQAPEAIDRIVQALANQQQLGTYNMDVFDLDDDDVEEIIDEAQTALEVSGNAIDEAEDDGTWT